MVKANAYGHGEVEAARAAVEAGADWLGIARVEEAAALRRAGIRKPILLLAHPPADAAGAAVELGLTPTLYTEPTARAFSREAVARGSRIQVHMKVDTGMHRYGVAYHEAEPFMNLVRSMQGLELSGIWTHFAVAEDVSNAFTAHQFKLFARLMDRLGPKASGLIRHMANSAATLTYPDAHYDMVRTGLAIYGVHPVPGLSASSGLEPAMSLHSRVGMTKRLRAGEAVSYGQRYIMPEDGFVSTVPCGYADGLRRALSNTGEVLVRGRRYLIAGTITMDHFLVDTGEDELQVGEEVVILGRQGEQCVTAQEMAGKMDTIPYEVLCGISARVRRIYRDSGSV